MQDSNVNETTETNAQGISQEDALISVEIVKKALEYRPYIIEGIYGPSWMELSREQRFEEMMTPRIGIFYPDDEKNFSCFFLRITGSDGPLAEVFLYPIEAAWSFLDEARSYMKHRGPKELTRDEVERRAFDFAVDMMLIMIDNIYQRPKLMMESFTMETISQWLSNMDNDELRYYSEHGVKVRKRKDRILERMLKTYSDSVKELWKYQGQSRENWRKIRFVDQYEFLTKHWKRLLKMIGEGEEDWKEYATAGKYQDTPDDLIEKLWNMDRGGDDVVKSKVSELALEHAARRVGLIKATSVSEWARGKRARGIKVTDYSITQLFTFLQEGKDAKTQAEQFLEIQRRIATYPKPESGSDPASEKKRKSLEQKIDFVTKKFQERPESDRDSAMEQNA